METHAWDYFKTLIQLAIVPMIGYIWTKNNKEIENIQKEIDTMQVTYTADMTSMKIENATLRVQLNNISERLNELKVLMNLLIQECKK